MQVPALYAPFPTAIHPAYQAIEQATRDWGENNQVGSPELRERLARHDLGVFGARILPHTADTWRPSWLGDFVWWLFAVDDGLCEEAALGHRPGALAAQLSDLLYVAEFPHAQVLLDDPLARALRDLRRRLADHATDAQLAAWIAALREYVMSVVREAHYRAKGAVPDLNAYTIMRLHDGATSVVPPILEIGDPLTDDERGRPDVRALISMASMIICWDNDILSNHKEIQDSTTTRYYLNALRVLEEHYGCRSGDALRIAVDQRNRVTLRFVTLAAEVQSTGSPALGRYVDALCDFIAAALAWGLSSARYPRPEDHPITLTTSPAGISADPLDIPATTWWWNHPTPTPAIPPRRQPPPATAAALTPAAATASAPAETA